MVGMLKSYISGFDRQLWLLFAGEIISSTGRAVAMPFLSLYLYNQIGLPMVMVGAGMTISSVVGIGFQFLAGPLSDYLGRRPVIIAGMVGTALVMISVIFVTTFEHYVLLSIGLGIALSLQPTASRAMVADVAAEDRLVQSYSLLYIATNVGFSLGPALGGFIAVIGYHYLFGAAFCTELVVIAIFFALLRETHVRKKTESMGSTLRGIGEVFRDRAFMLYCSFGVLLAAAYSLLFSVLPVYAYNYLGVNEVGIGFMWMLNASMVLVLQLPTARFIEHRNRWLTLFAGSLFYAVGFAAFGLAGGFVGLLLVMAVITIGENIISPAMSALVAELAPEDMRGRYMAFNGISWTIGYGTGPLVGGLLLDVALDVLWPVAGVTCLVAAFGFFGLRRVRISHRS